MPKQSAVPSRKKPTVSAQKPTKKVTLKPPTKPTPEDITLQTTDIAIPRRSTRAMLESLLSNYRGIQVQAKELEDSRREVGKEITEILENHDLRGVRYGAISASRSTVRRETIKPESLLAAGVDPVTIREATTVTEYEQLTVRAAKGNGDFGGGGEGGE